MSKGTIPTRRPYLWPLGPGGMVQPDRIVATGAWKSAPIRRATHLAKDEGRLIDLTYGQAATWVLFLDSGHLVLTSAAMPVTALEVEDDAMEMPPWEE